MNRLIEHRELTRIVVLQHYIGPRKKGLEKTSFGFSEGFLPHNSRSHRGCFEVTGNILVSTFTKFQLAYT